ncbi:MAG: TIGR02996 domain-containing protein [Gemmataceae bacterium]
MTTREGLWQAILDRPGDELARLIYADWLEEHGETVRAEFIRVQVRLAKLRQDDPEYVALQERQRELLIVHGRGWVEEYPAWMQEWGVRWRGGFLGEFQLSAERFLRSGGTLRRAAPVVALHLTQVRNQAKKVGQSPWLAGVQELNLVGGELNPDDLAELLASPHLGQVRSLWLEHNRVGVKGARHLARWPGLAQLEELSLRFNKIRDEGLAILLGSPHLGSLQELVLHGNRLTSAAGRILAACDRLGSLRKLDLGLARLGSEGMEHLSRAEALGGLESLNLRVALVGNAGVRWLTEGRWVESLREVDLNRNLLEEEAGQMLAQSHRLRLRRLQLGHNRLGDAGVRWLARAAALRTVRELDLRGNGLTDTGVECLAEGTLAELEELRLGFDHCTVAGVMRLLTAKQLPRLQGLEWYRDETLDLVGLAECPGLQRLGSLTLSARDVANDGLERLAASPWLPHLRSLSLNGMPVRLTVMAALASNLRLGQLEELSLAGTELGDPGAQLLAESVSLGRLTYLDLAHNRIGPVGAAALASAPGLTRLLALNVAGNPLDTASLQRLRRRFGIDVVVTR